MKEEWKIINGFNDRYQISNFGNVKTNRICKSTGCNYMQPHMTKSGNGQRGEGYLRICLTHPNGEQKKYFIHQLVAKAFIPNPKNRPHINHINCVRNDNRVENLEWCTPKENAAHTLKMGRNNAPKGENQYHSKLTEFQVIEIKKQLNEGILSMYRIAKNYGVHKVTIFDIKYGNTWKHI